MGWFSSLVGGAVGFLIGGPIGAVIGAGIGATKVGEKVVNTVLDFVLQPFMPSIPDIGGATEAERQQGVLVQRQGSTEQIPIVYGYRKVGGAVAFAETGSTDNKYLFVTYVFSEGLVEGLRELYIDDFQISNDLIPNLNAGQLVNITSGKYANRVQMRFYPGVYYSNPRSSTIGTTVKGDIFAESPTFTSDMVYNGLAVLFVRYEWKKITTPQESEENPFSGNIPQVQVCMLGKRVASLLVDTTETTAYDNNIIRYSTNPAECLLDYLRNPRYGKGLANTDIDWTTWKRAARKCNQTVTYIASGISGPILTMNMVVDTNQTLLSNTKTMLQNFRGYMPYVQGKYKLRIEDAGNETDILSGAALIVQTFTKDDIVSDITYNGIEKSSKYNVVSVTYVDPDQKFSNQTVIYPETEADRQIYIDRDGGRENKYDVTFGGITNYAIAKDMARLIFNKQRRQEGCVFTATSKALELEPGDCIRIQSNLLNFGTDPWRIVSVKINNDMTVDLGCVRNPDDIYPYVRVGEEDDVIPPYIPKGSIIYYPGSYNQLVGLVPPTNAVIPATVVTPITNPAPTNPSGPTGGGVGGGSPGGGTAGPIVTDPTTPPTVANPDTNNSSTPPPPPPPFDAVVAFKSVKATKLSNGNYLWELTLTQPQSATYAYAKFWFRYNQYSQWIERRIDNKPGPGLDFVYNLGELPKGFYPFSIRAVATDDRESTNVTQGTVQLIESQSGAAGNFVATGTAGTVSASLWSLPTAEVLQNLPNSDDIDWFEIRPQLSSGLPLDPRRLRFKIQQIQDATGKPVNFNINGVDIYYRANGDTYWTKESFDFPVTYLPGQIYENNLSGNFGLRNYPTSPSNWSVPGSIAELGQQYQFVVRLRYKDQKPALKQLGPATGRVEWNATGGEAGNPYNVYVYGLKRADLDASGIPQYVGGAVNEVISAAFNTSFLTTDQAPGGAFVSGLDIVPSVRNIVASRLNSILTFNLNIPNNTKFAGFKIRWRPIIPGSDPDFFETETARLPTSANDPTLITKLLDDANYKFGFEYDMVITATVSTSSGIVECTNSIISRHTILNGDPEYSNVYAKMNWQEIETVVAMKRLRDAFPAIPYVNVKSWNKIIQTKWDYYLPASDVEPSKYNSSNFGYNEVYLNTWYELTFQLPSTATHIVVYRRLWDSVGITRSSVTTVSRYYGLGPWEKVRVQKSTLTADAEGWYKINLRGPIAPSYFSQRYQVPNYSSSTLVNNDSLPTYNPFPSDGDSRALNDVRPYYGAGNNQPNALQQAQFLLVIEDGSGEAPRGLLLTEFRTENYGADYKRVRSGFGEGNVKAVQVSDTNASYNTPILAGYGRRLSEALTNTAFNRLHIQGLCPSSTTNFGYGPFNIFLSQPRDGSTVL